MTSLGTILIGLAVFGLFFYLMSKGGGCCGGSSQNDSHTANEHETGKDKENHGGGCCG